MDLVGTPVPTDRYNDDNVLLLLMRAVSARLAKTPRRTVEWGVP